MPGRRSFHELRTHRAGRSAKVNLRGVAQIPVLVTEGVVKGAADSV